jgi:hypothetical protein
MMDPFDEKGSRFGPRFFLPQGTHTFDEGI